jgi:hypothetical protein
VVVHIGERRILRNCNARFGFLCEYCANIFYFDWLAIGFGGVESATDEAGFYSFTLSLPTFGTTHAVPYAEGDPRSTGAATGECACGFWHGVEDDDLRGIATDCNTYDADAHIDHNYSIGDHWNATVAAVRRKWPSLEFFVVRESQERLAIHLHGVLRIHEKGMPDPEEVAAVLRGVTAKSHRGRTLAWGDAYVVQVPRRGSRRPRHGPHPGVGIQCAEDAIAYSMKATTSGLPRITANNAEFIALLQAAAERMRCDRCPEDGRTCRAPCHKYFGFRGHPISMSRPSPTTRRPGWALTGMTRTDKIDARRQYARERWQKSLGTPLVSN